MKSSEKEHSCPCCEDSESEIVKKLLKSNTTPSVMCDGVVKIADSQKNHRPGQLKERADRANGILTEDEKQKRHEALVKKMRDQLGNTRSSR